MFNPLRLDVLRRAINHFIRQQNIHVQVWVAINNDPLMEAPSYAFSYSYVGGIADTGKEVFRDFAARGAGSVAMKNIVVLLPYVAGKPVPRKGDNLYLYWADGTPYERVRTNYVIERRADTPGISRNTTFSIECHCEILEG